MKIGLISDTHMPERWKSLPERVFSSFEGVDLILHAGDVGELWVLDELSQIAPVVAVHGNDETDEATAALPYLQTLSIAGHRLVMTHAHYPIRAEEFASRTNDWESKFERRASFAKAHGASICIFGHTHIPMDLEYDGIRLINPGAIASGNVWTKQTVQTVAILSLEKGKSPEIQFIDLATGQDHKPYFDPAGFMETFTPYNEFIYEEALLPSRDWLWWTLGTVTSEVRQALHRLSFEVWEGKKEIVTVKAVMDALIALNHPNVLAEMQAEELFQAIHEEWASLARLKKFAQERYNAKDYAEAVVALSKLIEKISDTDEIIHARSRRAFAYEVLGQTESVLAELDWLIDNSDADANLYSWRGLYMQKLRRFDAALKDFTAAHRANINNTDYLQKRAQVLYEMKDYRAAIDDLNQVLLVAENPNYRSAVYHWRGLAYYRLEMMQEALNDFNEISKIHGTTLYTDAASYFHSVTSEG